MLCITSTVQSYYFSAICKETLKTLIWDYGCGTVCLQGTYNAIKITIVVTFQGTYFIKKEHEERVAVSINICP